ncbi:MAG TPA: hypothetical protein DEV81_24480, partial [Cyanobacteria bacterium UBA11049]|nr:hypothetical protein [Cyanobacteria bacterium UBA11049]
EERTKASLQLQANETKFRRLVSSNIIGVVSCNTHGTITEANDEFLRMTGFTHEDVRTGGVRWDEMTPLDLKHLDKPALEETDRKRETSAV